MLTNSIRYRTPIRKICCIYSGLTSGHPGSEAYLKDLLYFSWTDECASCIRRLSERFDVSFHRLTNGYPTSNGLFSPPSLPRKRPLLNGFSFILISDIRFWLTYLKILLKYPPPSPRENSKSALGLGLRAGPIWST